MGKKDKLIKRLKSRPKDFTFDEAEVLLGYFLIREIIKGRLVVRVLCLLVMVKYLFYYINLIREKNC